MTIRRREFLASIPVALASATAFARQGDVNEALRSFLQPHVLKRSTLDQFLDSKARTWAKFDPELGYLLRNAFVRDGVYAWRWLAFPEHVLESMSGTMFHANPWVHARLDDRVELDERDNLCPTEASLYQLCDLEFLIDTFRDDEIVHLLFAQRTGAYLSLEVLEKVAAKCDAMVPDSSSPEAIKAGATRLLQAYSVRVGIAIMDRLLQYCKHNGKELLVLLSYPVGAVWHACNRSSPADPDNTDWHPQYFKDHLAARGIRLVDSLPAHVAEFDTFKLTAKEYVDRYYIGHYTPRGNHFFAYAIKDAIRDWLTTLPPAYQNNGEPLIRFQGYLPG